MSVIRLSQRTLPFIRQNAKNFGLFERLEQIKAKFYKSNVKQNPKEKKRLNSYAKEDSKHFEAVQGYLNKEVSLSRGNTLLQLMQKTLVAINFLNCFEAATLDKLCKLNVEMFFEPPETQQEAYLSLLKETGVHNSQFLASQLVSSFFLVHSFLDYGMKGLLAGDISYTSITEISPIIKTYAKKIDNLGIDKVKLDELTVLKDIYKSNNFSNLVYGSKAENQDKLQYSVDLDNDIYIPDDSSRELQDLINEMYKLVAKACLTNSHKTPVYGIPHPEKENQANMFKRQLIVEQASFEKSAAQFKKIVNQLQQMQATHKLNISTRYIQSWLKDVKYAVTETQRMILSKGEYKKQGKGFLQFFVPL